MDFSSIIDKFQDEALLGSLNVDDSKTFVELLLLAVFADGEVTEEELHGLNDQWAQLPFANDPELEDVIGEHGFEFRSRIEAALESGEGIDALLESSARKLSDTREQEAALRMVAIVTGSDGLDASEVDLTYRLGDHFGFDSNKTAEIVEDIFDA
ncbi:unnamed protein product, partial [Laminaria digitata]